MVLIILVIGRIVLIKRKPSANKKLHGCSTATEIKPEDVISLDSDLNSTDHATNANIPRDEVKEIIFIK